MNPFVTLKGCKVELRLGGLPAALTGSVAGWDRMYSFCTVAPAIPIFRFVILNAWLLRATRTEQA